MTMTQVDLFGEVKPPPTFVLRPYQEEAVRKIMWSMSAGLEGNDLLVLPTGAGKSLIIAEIARRIDDHVLVLQPSKELLEQNLEKLLRYVTRDEVGVYSASMNEKTIGRYTLATIQSIYKKPDLFSHFGLFLLDEAHLLNMRSLEGMFMSFIRQVNAIRAGRGEPPVKIVGLTATPYRQATAYAREDGGLRAFCSVKLVNRMLAGGKGGQIFWRRIMYNVHIEDLMKQGYLCPLEYVDRSVIDHHQMKLNVSRTDFDLESFDSAMRSHRDTVMAALDWAQANAKSVLVFCASVAQATRLAADVAGAAVVSAKTPPKEREAIIAGFKDGTIKTVFNMGVLTTGFDHPALDCIVLMRPTKSIALYAQMLGRGVRNAPGKTSCKVVDLTSTVKNVGRFETIKVVKREKWELESEKRQYPQSWHGCELYQYVIDLTPKAPEPPTLPKAGAVAVSCETCGTIMPRAGTPCVGSLLH